MLCRARALEGYRVIGPEGVLGKAAGLHFDDRHWAIRYLVADTGPWFARRRIVIPPSAVGAVLEGEKRITLTLTRRQIEAAPPGGVGLSVPGRAVGSPPPRPDVPGYRDSPPTWSSPLRFPSDRDTRGRESRAGRDWETHDTCDLTGYQTLSVNGDCGRIEDCIVDDEAWTIRYLIVDTRDWLPGRRVLVSAQWVERVDWSESRVFVKHAREAVQKAPEYSEHTLLDLEHDSRMRRRFNP